MSTPIKETNDMSTPDYAARLREAMDTHDEKTETPPSDVQHEDDVARLLREQLALFERPTDKPADTSTSSAASPLWEGLEEFEDEEEVELLDEEEVELLDEEEVELLDEEEEEILAEEEEEILDEEEEEILDEEEEEILAEEEEEILAEEEEEILAEEEEEILAEEEEEILAEEEEEILAEEEEEILAEEEEEILAEEEEEILDEEEEEILDEEEEEILAEGEEEILDVAQVSDEPESLNLPVAEETMADILQEIGFEEDMIEGVEPVEDDVINAYLQEIETWKRAEDAQDTPVSVTNMTDDDINRHTIEDTLSGAVLSQLDEETRASLRRMGMVEDAETVQLDVFSAEPQPEMTEEDTCDEEAPCAVDVDSQEGSNDTEDDTLEDVWHDPLQLTLDEYQKTRRYPQPTKDVPPTAEETPPHVAEHYTPTEPEETYQRDTEMYVNLGYEADIGRTQDASIVGNVSETSDREDTYLRGETDTRNTEPVAYGGKEYTSSAQNCTIERAYQKATIRGRINLWVTLAVALCGLIYDLLPVLSQVLGDPVATYVTHRAYPAYGILLLWFGMLPSITKLFKGLRSLWEFKPVIYAMPAVAVFLVWLQTMVACFMPTLGMQLYIGSALLLVFFANLCDCFRADSEQISFRVVSSGKATYVLAQEPVSMVEDTPSDDETYVHAWRVRKVSKLSDYFMWVTRYQKNQSVIGTVIPLAFLGGLAVGCGVVITEAIRSDAYPWVNAIAAFVGVFIAALPAGFMINMTLPLMLANRIIGRHGSTVLSADVADVYAPCEGNNPNPIPDAVKLSFMAVDVLGAGHVKEITVKGDAHTDEYRKMARRLFALLGSPLSGEDNKLRPRDLAGIHLEIAEADETCLRLYMVDKKREIACEILMGTHEALLRCGIRLPREHMESKYKKTDDSRVIYLAFDRKFRLAYATKYMPRRSFAGAVPMLSALGHTLSVVSFDPLVTNEVLAPACTPHVPSITLTRPDHITEEREHRSCGILATGRAVDITYPLLACRCIKKAEWWGKMLTYGAMVLAILLSAVLLWTGLLPAFSTWMLWLWQFAVVGVAGLVCFYHVRPKTLSMTPPTPKNQQK